MNRYLSIPIICFGIVIWAVIGIGCIPAATIKKDCWDVSAERCAPCVRAGYDCEIWLGSTPRTPVHTEACIVENGKRIWLQDVGKYSVLLDPDYSPNFTPLMRFDYHRFINLIYLE